MPGMPSTPSAVETGATRGSSLRSPAPFESAWVCQPVWASTMRRAVSGMVDSVIPPRQGRVAAQRPGGVVLQAQAFKDTFEFAIDLVITEPEYPVSKTAQSFIPEIIPRSVIVKPHVDVHR